MVCFGEKPCWLVGSVQNLRAGHFPLVTLVTLVRPIEGGVGWGWEINSYGWFCVLKLKRSQKKINLDMPKREPGRKGGWTRKNWGVELGLEGEVGRVDNSLITGCVSADRVCSRSREVNRVIDWDYYCTHQCCAESSKIWNVELTSPGPVPINLGSCMLQNIGRIIN